jgi:CRP-like cAMP-binding protein
MESVSSGQTISPILVAQSQEILRSSKPPDKRTEDEIGCLREWMKHVWSSFGALMPPIQTQLLKAVQYSRLNRNSILCYQGDEGNHMYVLLQGSCDVIQEDAEGIEGRVAGLRGGDKFGEMSLLTGERRNATIKCVEVCEFVSLEKTDYDRILRSEDSRELQKKLAFLMKLPPFKERSR